MYVSNFIMLMISDLWEVEWSCKDANRQPVECKQRAHHCTAYKTYVPFKHLIYNKL
ncbi:hypothetical protein E2C01_032726 [Portunus trituberculatus]|uniref:Uncharacterized protein n=1 Tax=Portunus trituberculatus TaxID=210409 RepID=A0A5B7EW02_PORTR|nr:hypothetical protein [Portunus trituberculatus]